VKNAESAETEESAEIMRAENANAENMGNAHNTSQPNLLIFSTFLSSHLDFDIPLMTNFLPHMSFFPHMFPYSFSAYLLLRPLISPFLLQPLLS